MKKQLGAILLVLTMLTLVSCSQTLNPETIESEIAQTEAEYIKISAAEAKGMIDSEDVVILDVRTTEEFEEAHIEGALLIPDYEIEILAEEMIPAKETTILVYCRTGRRSEIASKTLIEMGYKNVYDFGGIVDWSYETTSGK